MRLQLIYFLLKEFLFLSTKHCHWCCQFGLVGIRSCALGFCGFVGGCGEGPFQGAQRELELQEWLELLLSVLEAKGSCLREQLGQIMFHNCVLSKVGVNSVSEALVLPLPCAELLPTVLL